MNKEPLDKMNQDIINRVFPDFELKPNLDFRPISTKYMLFPLLNKTEPEPLSRPYSDFYTETNFTGSISKGPVNLSKQQILLENELRGQNIPLHRGDVEIKHIPSLKSDLYTSSPAVKSEAPKTKSLDPSFHHNNNPHNNLKISSMSKVGTNSFHNHTRTQLRQLY
jgi:hypothetical protein